jgi:hypothetical protein
VEYIPARLRDTGAVKREIVICDATFIKAYSKRDPEDESRGYSDPDARVGKVKKTYELGRKLYLH